MKESALAAKRPRPFPVKMAAEMCSPRNTSRLRRVLLVGATRTPYRQLEEEGGEGEEDSRHHRDHQPEVEGQASQAQG